MKDKTLKIKNNKKISRKNNWKDHTFTKTSENIWAGRRLSLRFQQLRHAEAKKCLQKKRKKENHLALHKRWSFSLRISSVSVTKSAVFCGFGRIYRINPQWKTSSFLCSVVITAVYKQVDLYYINKFEYYK